MQSRDLIERRLVKRPTNKPALVLIAVKIALPQILDPDKAFRGIVKINFRDSNSMGIEKLRDPDVVPVFFAFQIVLNKDQLLVRGAIDSIKFSIRASFYDRLDRYLIDIQTRKMHSRLSEEQRRFHDWTRCRCRDGCRWPLFGSGQYNPEGEFGKQFVLLATKLCLQGWLLRRRDNVLR